MSQVQNLELCTITTMSWTRLFARHLFVRVSHSRWSPFYHCTQRKKIHRWEKIPGREKILNLACVAFHDFRNWWISFYFFFSWGLMIPSMVHTMVPWYRRVENNRLEKKYSFPFPKPSEANFVLGFRSRSSIRPGRSCHWLVNFFSRFLFSSLATPWHAKQPQSSYELGYLLGAFQNRLARTKIGAYFIQVHSKPKSSVNFK